MGRMVTEDVFGPPLAAFIRGDLDLKPDTPPTPNLGRLLYSLDPETLSAIALMPLLDGWARGWDWEKQSTGTVYLEAGREFEAHLDTELTERQLGRTELTDLELGLAGAWLVKCATTMSYLDYDGAGFPIVAPDWEPYVSECRKILLRRHPVHLAHETEPPPWTGWRQHFPGRSRPLLFAIGDPKRVRRSSRLSRTQIGSTPRPSTLSRACRLSLIQ